MKPPLIQGPRTHISVFLSIDTCYPREIEDNNKGGNEEDGAVVQEGTFGLTSNRKAVLFPSFHTKFISNERKYIY